MKGLPRSLSRAQVLSAPAGFVRLRYPFANQALTIAAAGAGAGLGNLSFGLPEGYLYLDSASAMFSLATTSANITNATFGGLFSLGTTADADGTLGTTDANLIASTALNAAVAKVTTANRGATATRPAVAGVQDNHSKTMSMFLNFAITAADIADASSAPFTANGFVELVLAVLGDN